MRVSFSLVIFFPTNLLPFHPSPTPSLTLSLAHPPGDHGTTCLPSTVYTRRDGGPAHHGQRPPQRRRLPRPPASHEGVKEGSRVRLLIDWCLSPTPHRLPYGLMCHSCLVYHNQDDDFPLFVHLCFLHAIRARAICSPSSACCSPRTIATSSWPLPVGSCSWGRGRNSPEWEV